MEYSIKYFRKEGRKEGVDYATVQNIYQLVEKHGWSIEDALNTFDVKKSKREVYRKKVEEKKKGKQTTVK